MDERNLSPAQLTQIRTVFNECCADGIGITLEELRTSLIRMGLDVTPDDARELFDQFDTDHSGVIDFAEFVAGLGPVILSKQLDTEVATASDAVSDEEPEFTEAELKYLHEVFDSVDLDLSGAIDKIELAGLLRQLGHDVDDDMLDVIFNRHAAELQADGQMGFVVFQKEFGNILLNKTDPKDESVSFSDEQIAMIRSVFNKVDTDKSGTVDIGELEGILINLGQVLEPEELQHLLARLDTQGNGVIDFEDFVAGGMGKIIVESMNSAAQGLDNSPQSLENKLNAAKEILSGRQVTQFQTAWAEVAKDKKTIPSSDIKRLMALLGVDIGRDKLRHVIHSVDPNVTGIIYMQQMLYHWATNYAPQEHRAADQLLFGSMTDFDLSSELTVEKAAAKITELRNDNARLVNQVQALQAEVSIIKDSAERMETDRIQLRDEITQMKTVEATQRKKLKQMELLQHDKADISSQLDEANDRLRLSREELEKLRQKYERLEDANKQMLMSIDHLQTDLSKQQDEAKEQLDIAEGRGSKEVDVLKHQVKDLQKALKISQERLQDAEKMSSVVTELRGEIVKHQQEIGDLKARNKVASSLERSDSRVGDMRRQDGSLMDELSQLGEVHRDVRTEQIAQLSRRVEELRVERDELQDQLDKREAVIEEAKALAAAAKADADRREAEAARRAASAADQVSQNKRVFEDLAERQGEELQRMEERFLATKAELDTTLASEAELKQRLADVEKELRTARETIEANAGSMRALTKRADIAEGSLERERESMNVERSQLEAVIKELNERIAQLEPGSKKTAAAAAEAGEARARADQAEKRIAALEADLLAKTKEIEELRRLLAEKEAQLTAEAKGSADLKARLKKLQDDLESRDAQLTDADATRADRERLARERMELEERLADMQTKSSLDEDHARRKLAEVEARLKAESDARAALVASTAALEKERDGLVSAKTALETEKADLRKQVDTKDAECTTLGTQLVAERQLKESITAEKKRVDEELANLRAQLDRERRLREELEAHNRTLGEEAARAAMEAEKKAKAVVPRAVEDYELAPNDAALVDFVSQMLAGDSICASHLPIGHRALNVATATGDGVLLCILLNRLVPEAIDERVLKKRVVDEEDAVDNLCLCINSAQAAGCSVFGIKADKLLKGEVPVILRLMLEIVKVGLLSNVSLRKHPELMALQDAAKKEDAGRMSRLPPEELLMRWINFHLGVAAHAPAANVGRDFADGQAFLILLNRVAPELCGAEARELPDPRARAAAVLENAAKLHARHFISVDSIVDGNEIMNLLFLANLFHLRSGIAVTELQQAEAAKAFVEVEGSREERAYRLWIMSMGIDRQVNDLREDFKDGLALLELEDKLWPGSVEKSKVNTGSKLSNRYKVIENCNLAVSVAKKNKISIVSIDGANIVDGNVMLTLAIVWQLMRQHVINLIASMSLDGKIVTDAEVVKWANDKVKAAGKSTSMKSFQDKTLANSLFIIDLLAALRPRAVDYTLVTPGSSDEEKVMNAKYAINVARKLGAVVFLVFEDILEVNQKMIMTLIGALMSLGP